MSRKLDVEQIKCFIYYQQVIVKFNLQIVFLLFFLLSQLVHYFLELNFI